MASTKRTAIDVADRDTNPANLAVVSAKGTDITNIDGLKLRPNIMVRINNKALNIPKVPSTPAILLMAIVIKSKKLSGLLEI